MVSLSLLLCDSAGEETVCFAGVISSISLLLGCEEPWLLVEVVPLVRNIKGGRSFLSSDSAKWKEKDM